MVFKFIPQTQLERTANFASRPSTTVQSGASDHLQERSNKIIPNYSDKDVCSILYYWPLIFFLENECVSYHILWPLAQFCLFELATAFHIQNSIEVLPNAELLLNYQLFHWLQGRGFHFGTPGTPPPPGRGNSCKAEAVEDKLTLSEIYLVYFRAQFPDGFGILRSFQMAQKNAAGIGAASKLLLEFEERERIAAELSSSWKDVGRRFVSPLRREELQKERCDLSEHGLDRRVSREWMVQSARRGLKDYWQRGKMAPPLATSLPHKDFQDSRIWIQVLAVQVKNSHAQIVISLPLVLIFKPDVLVCFLHRIPQLISFAISFFS